MIRLQTTHVRSSILIALVALVGLGSHLFLYARLARPEKEIARSPRVPIGAEEILQQPPAIIVDQQDRLHYLSLPDKTSFHYKTFDARGRLVSDKVIRLPRQTQALYYAPIAGSNKKPHFLVTLQRTHLYEPYLLDPQQGRWTPLSVAVPEANDIAAASDGTLDYVAYIEKTPNGRLLYIRSGQGGEWGPDVLAASSPEYLGLPRLICDTAGLVHLVWKETRGGGGVTRYNCFDPAQGRLKHAGNIALGRAAVNLWTRVGEGARFYKEDVGARLTAGPRGDVYVTWTFSNVNFEFELVRSEVFVSHVLPGGRITGPWRFTGTDGFAAFADIAIPKDEAPLLVFENYRARRFQLYTSKYQPSTGSFEKPRLFTGLYGTHRLASAQTNSRGDVLIAWRELHTGLDSVWLRSSARSNPPRWYDRWALWFVGQGAGSTVRETFFLLLYALVGVLVTVASSALTLVVFILLLHALQRLHVLGQCSFFLGLSIGVIILFVFKTQLPIFYTSAVAEEGFTLFASLFATLATFLLSRDHWFRAAEELVYVKYILLWMTSDALISMLYMAPKVFAPWM